MFTDHSSLLCMFYHKVVFRCFSFFFLWCRFKWALWLKYMYDCQSHLETFKLLLDDCQHLNLSLPHKGKHPSCEWHLCIYESQRMFKSEFTTWENPPFCVFLRFLPLCNAAITFFRVPLTPQTFLFCPRLLPLSAFLSSCSEECFGAVSVWGFWCFTELLWKKKKQRLHELD